MYYLDRERAGGSMCEYVYFGYMCRMLCVCLGRNFWENGDGYLHQICTRFDMIECRISGAVNELCSTSFDSSRHDHAHADERSEARMQ